MIIEGKQTARLAGALAAMALAGALLAGCTGDVEPPASSAGPSAGAGKQTDSPDVTTPAPPSEVPPVETTPPVLPTDPPGRQDSVIETLPGDAKAGCVDVGSERDVRSETMAAGNFMEARAQFAASPAADISMYFIPSDVSGEPELVVEISKVGGPVADVVRTSSFQTADQWRYYPVRITISESGTWQLKATAGAGNIGCWVVDFGQ